MTRSMLALAVALSSVSVSPLLAQSTTPAPAQTTPALATETTAGSANFITQAQAGQYRASKLAGVNIYNSKDESIGEVNELVVDKNGSIQAVVIGVGGFLGIGEKNVALPYNAIKWEDKAKQSDLVGMSQTNTMAPGTPAAPPPPVDNTVRDYPDHGILNMTKDQLNAAPDFKFASEAQK